MIEITKNNVVSAIDNFLCEQRDKKLEPEFKRLEKANDSESKEKIQSVINALYEKFLKENWLDDAAKRMAKQLTFGTHISKGVHPDAKGDNVNFVSEKPLSKGLVGSQLLTNPELDANGNAAALSLAAFYNIELGNVKLRHLIQQGHGSIDGVFSDNTTLSNERYDIFKASLNNVINDPVAHERNKQILWPLDEAIKNNHYCCLLPLYPSSLTHFFYHKVNGSRYSEENKEARDNRHKKTAEHKPYVSIRDLSATILGGTKPQNVSLLTSKQGGRNYLLPSLPPVFTQTKSFTLAKKQTSFFCASLRYHCYFGFQELFSAIDAPKNTMNERDQRKDGVQMILAQVVSLASTIQQRYVAGWSDDYFLDINQKYWLDPRRSDLSDQEAFKLEKVVADWLPEIQSQFAFWLNAELRKQYPKKSHHFDDTEFTEWKREIESIIKANQRAQKGVFV